MITWCSFMLGPCAGRCAEQPLARGSLRLLDRDEQRVSQAPDTGARAHRPGDAGKHGERACHGPCTQGSRFFLPARSVWGRAGPGPCASLKPDGKIGEVLIREGHLTQEGSRRRWTGRSSTGGRLGTNLLELKLVEEEQLARAWEAARCGGRLETCPWTPRWCPRSRSTSPTGRKWSPGSWRSPAQGALLRDQAQRAGPASRNKTGRTCVPVVAPEFRVYQLLRANLPGDAPDARLAFWSGARRGRTTRRKRMETRRRRSRRCRS